MDADDSLATDSCEDEESEESDDDEEHEGLLKKEPIPFCQSGFGLTTTGFPPAYLPLPGENKRKTWKIFTLLLTHSILR